MTEMVKLLKGIMRTSGWTQEQLAAKLGVSFASLNSWVNGRSRPRKAMMERIRKLYLAQDITKDKIPIYVTLVNVGSDLRVGDAVLLTKDLENEWDDEAIRAGILELDEKVEAKNVEDEGNVGEMGGIGEDEWDTAAEDEFLGIRVEPEYIGMDMYVANSVHTVVRGTCSSGRIYDKFDLKARAQVVFIFKHNAIARIVEWNYKG